MITGIELTWDSNQECTSAQTESDFHSFTAKVLCDETNTKKGEAEILTVDRSDECNPIVSLKHASGCPIEEGSHRAARLMRLFGILLIGFTIFLLVLCMLCCCCIRSRKIKKTK